MTKGEINGTRIYNRLLIPIYENRILVNVECRDFTSKSSKKVIYPRGCKSDLVFNLDRLDKDKPIYLTEGIMDLPNLFNLGERNIGSIFGTGLTKSQIEFLRSIKNIVYLPDNDEPGFKVLDLLEECMEEEFYIAFIPKNRKDPGDCTISELKTAIENKISSQDYLLNKLELFKTHPISW
jgi:DNA primase